MVGDHGADRVALAVVGLLPEQDEVGLLGLEHLCEGVAGRADVRAGERVVGELHGAVGAEGDRLVERPHRGLRAHRHGHDLVHVGTVFALADLHRGLDAMGIERVEVLLAGAVEPLGPRIDPLLDRGVRHLLDETANLQVEASLGMSGGAY